MEDKCCSEEGNVPAQCWGFEPGATNSGEDGDACLPHLPLLLSTCVISARNNFSISPLPFSYL